MDLRAGDGQFYKGINVTSKLPSRNKTGAGLLERKRKKAEVQTSSQKQVEELTQALTQMRALRPRIKSALL